MKTWEINPITFGEDLRKIRLEHGLTQSKLAGKLYHTSVSAVKNWEQGVSLPNVATIIDIAKVFGFGEVKIDTSKRWYV